jgi:phosphoglycerate dehydrogenase-like enzyme
MKQPEILVFAPSSGADDSYRSLEEAGCRVALGDKAWHVPHGDHEDDMCSAAEKAQALMGASIHSCPITHRILEGAKNLRIVAKYTIGTDDVDVDAATGLGILVTHCPTEANWGGVAEGAIAMMLALLKKTREKDEYVKGGGWRDPSLQGTYLGARQDGYPGITVGIIGLGRIGSRVADLLAPWRVRILACDPYVDWSKFVHHNATPVDLQTLLERSDVVTLHVDLTEETRQMIGRREFGHMKPDAVLINTSRGKTVAEEALVDALEQGKIAGAALDVFEDEPLGEDSTLKKLGNKVLLSPHMVAMNAGAGLGPGITWATQSVLLALDGKLPDNVYNKVVIPRWRERFEGKSLIGGGS